MTDGWDVAEGDPWSVSCGPNEFTRVVRLRVGDFTIALTALSAHKLGSALHAASGLESSDITTAKSLKSDETSSGSQ
jgi:hypothetical protein